MRINPDVRSLKVSEQAPNAEGKTEEAKIPQTHSEPQCLQTLRQSAQTPNPTISDPCPHRQSRAIPRTAAREIPAQRRKSLTASKSHMNASASFTARAHASSRTSSSAAEIWSLKWMVLSILDWIWCWARSLAPPGPRHLDAACRAATVLRSRATCAVSGKGRAWVMRMDARMRCSALQGSKPSP